MIPMFTQRPTFGFVPRALLLATAATAVVSCARNEAATQAKATDPWPVLLADVGAGGAAMGDAIAQAEEGLVNADSLKRRGIARLRMGDFDAGAELIDQALDLRPDDVSLRRIDGWVEEFQGQHDQLEAERLENFEEQVANVRLLTEAGYESYAIRAAHLASSYAADPEAFAQQDWVQALIKRSVELAEAYEERGEWLRSMRVWSDLAGLEALNPTWNRRQKQAQRRVRLLFSYAPDILTELREGTQAERDAVERLLAENDDDPTNDELSTTRPTTQPGDEEEEATSLDDAFRTDWRDTVAGVTKTMLRDALSDASQYHVREMSIRDALLGGLEAVEALATTPGLERTFPTLADEELRKNFVAAVAEQRERLEALVAVLIFGTGFYLRQMIGRWSSTSVSSLPSLPADRSARSTRSPR